MWNLASDPDPKNYRDLAAQLLTADAQQMHPALWQRREAMTERLKNMADEPQRDQNISIYHAMSLLLWPA